MAVGPAGISHANGAVAGSATPLGAYLVDAAQRTVLFLDVLRQRGNQYLAHKSQAAPNVLNFEHDLVIDGRSLARPVNYGLVRVDPPGGRAVDPTRRPIVVVDPRAGHGPGIGGFKADSEIGVALAAGHPVYFVGFLPDPAPGQTLEDVMAAEAVFLERVAALHPQAVAKPFVIGNCQAGWALLMLAAIRPELFGPLLVAGAPVAYWEGERGGSAMRYSGGLMGGSWLTALVGDLGHGRFDGAHLVSNFESMNPANTLWTKQYNVWAHADTEAGRYLGFERWWGGHVVMNAAEMQFIVDQLFVGNKLASAEIITRDGDRIDLRNIVEPIIVFCSKGDDITPPQQALGWITQLYESDQDILADEQTIVYAVHDHIGHLGIFVSGSVARKEHEEFAENIDLIDVLPPGLYEAVLVPKSEVDGPTDLVRGEWITRFERRSLADLRALGGNTPDENAAFATAARVSDINLGLYRTFAQPVVRAMATPAIAEQLERCHPLRLGFELFADANPWMRSLGALADTVREQRRPIAADNPFLAWQEAVSTHTVAVLDAYKAMRDRAVEQMFFGIYGSAWLQAMVGLRARGAALPGRPGLEPARRDHVRRRQAELRGRMTEGGPLEAMLRGILYVGMRSGAIDERHFELLRRMRESRRESITLDRFKTLVREQFLMLVLNEDEALLTLPGLLAGAPEAAADGLATLRRIAAAGRVPAPAAAERLARVEAIFEAAIGGSAAPISPRAAAVPENDMPVSGAGRRPRAANRS